MPDFAKDVIAQWERLEGERGTWKTHWQTIADLMLPDRADYFVQRSPGQKRMTHVVDSTAILALQQFAGGMHSLLTSPTLQWFGLKPDAGRFDDDQEVRGWFDQVSVVMYSVFNGPRHNFASQSHELYLDLGSIGTGVMAVLESDRSGILFSTKHLRECVVAENEEDRIDVLIRKWSYTAKQAVEAWGRAAGEQVLKAYADQPDKKFDFLHCVRPRRERALGRADRRNKPFESLYVSMADRHVIDEGGFDEFP